MANEESSVYTRWIGRLFGYRRFVNQPGDALPERAKVEVRGALIYDNPANSSTVIDFANISAAQHGSLAGGGLHAAATTSAAGFMSAADKTKLDGSTSAATPSKLVTRDGSGHASFVDAKAERFVRTVDESVTRTLPLHWSSYPVSGAPSWESSFFGYPRSVTTNGGGTLHIPLSLPHGARLDSVKAWVLGAGTGPGDPLPATLPELSIVSVEMPSQTTTTVGTASDPGNAGYRSTIHAVTVTPSSTHTIDATSKRYLLQVRPEQGTNAQQNVYIYGVEVTITWLVGSPVIAW